MIKIDFKLDEDVIARAMIPHSNGALPFDFADYLFKKYPSSFYLLKQNMMSTKIDMHIIDELKTQTFFKEALKRARENFIRIKQNWKLNSTKINNFLQSIFRKKFSLKITAFITPPDFYIGRKLGNKIFIWGNVNGLKNGNYDLVYLVHEALHYYFKDSDLTHTIIENITDIELAKFLNISQTGYPHHPYTQDLHIKIYPYWNLYLNKSIEDIEQDKKVTNIHYNVRKFEPYRKEISNMNIDEFENFVAKNISNVNYKTIYKIK